MADSIAKLTAVQGENPVLVEIYRDGAVESVHRGSAVVTSLATGIIAAWGTIDADIFPRSAIKPLQAIPLLVSGAADRFSLSDAEIALACASHSGTTVHVATVLRWLARIGLSEEALGCGPHWPTDADAARALARERTDPRPIHNNCSGKHAGFVTTALHLNVAIETYLDPASPVQRCVREVIQEMCSVDSGEIGMAIDGCGAPAPRFPLIALADGFAHLGTPDRLPEPRARACRRITDAMVANPGLVAGHDRFDTVAMSLLAGAVVTKSGAEGVRAAALRGKGIGLAVKIDDGATRAADIAMAALLRRFAEGPGAASAGLAGLETPLVYNTLGRAVGTMQPASAWAADLRAR